MTEVDRGARAHTTIHDDDALERLARQHLARSPALQVVGELMHELRQLAPSWWAPAILRGFWPAQARMGWLEPRPDRRQIITSTLTGLSPNAARSRSAATQAELIDAALDHGDVSVDAFEAAFDVYDMVVHGPAAELWQRFRAQLPLDDRPEVRAFLARLLGALLADRDAAKGQPRKPILSAYDLRAAIDPHAWHESLPLALRVAVDEARMRQERLRPTRPFQARHELGIVGVEQLAEHLPLGELERVLDRAGEAMGFTEAAPEEAPGSQPSSASPWSPVSLVAPRLARGVA